METVNSIIEILAASLTPVVAIIGIIIGIKTYILSLRRRKDDLFDRRYKFLKAFEQLWKITGLESQGATRPWLEWDDMESYAQESFFLFGNDIAQHLRS